MPCLSAPPKRARKSSQGDGSGLRSQSYSEARKAADDGESTDSSAQRASCLPPAPLDLAGNKMVQVACGLHHSVLLTTSGEVFTFGSNQHGQLGTGDNNPRSCLVKMKVPLALQVAAGSNHTVVLTRNGEVFTVGSNNVSRLNLT